MGGGASDETAAALEFGGPTAVAEFAGARCIAPHNAAPA
jgi:hypothetical protein